MAEARRETIAFEVDRNALFDALAKVGDGGQALGARLVGVLLTGDPSFREALGLGFYGIALADLAKEGSDA